jgi:SNF2-related domain
MSELIYSIDKTFSENTNTLVIKIEEASKEGSYYKPISKQHPLLAASLKKLSSKEESEVIAFLIKEELRYLKKIHNKSFDEKSILLNFIHISYSESFQALQHLAGTGKLYFNGKPLICDFYSKIELFYEVTKKNALNYATGHLKLRDKNIDLHSCDFICGSSPPVFIYGITLKVITTEVSWQALKQAYYEPSLALEKLDMESFEKDPLAPKLFFIGDSKEAIIQSTEPSPILLLKERYGAFADLMMDYGSNEIIPFQDPVSKGQVTRQIQTEKAWEKDLLETDFIKKTIENSHYFCPMDKIAKSLSFLLEIGWKIIDFKGRRVLHQTSTDLSLQSQATAILVKGKINYDHYSADISTVVGAFNRRDRFVQLSTDAVGLIPQNWENTDFNGWIEESEVVQEGIKIKRNKFGCLSHLIDSNTPLDASLLNLKERLNSFHTIDKNFPPSQLFKGELRFYQQEGVNWLSFLYDFGFHGMLADDMGLGKTVQVIAFLSRLHLEEAVLIVVPTSLLFNWKKELEKFYPTMPVVIHHGIFRSKTWDNNFSKKIIITSYNTLRLDFAIFSNVSFQCVILDEAQMIKNPHTQIAKAIFQLQVRFRLSISGTPIENHLRELWSHFRFLMPDLLAEEQTFEANLQAASSCDNRYLQRIKKKIRPFILRRTKEEVAKDLPERIEQILWVQMHTSQREIYDAFLAGIRGNLIQKVKVDGFVRFAVIHY